MGGNVGIGTTNPAAKFDVSGTTRLGSAGTALSAMGACSFSTGAAMSGTPANFTCTGVPASTSVAVTCSGNTAMTASGSVYCRATGTQDQIACNAVYQNPAAQSYTCMWMQP